MKQNKKSNQLKEVLQHIKRLENKFEVINEVSTDRSIALTTVWTILAIFVTAVIVKIKGLAILFYLLFLVSFVTLIYMEHKNAKKINDKEFWDWKKLWQSGCLYIIIFFMLLGVGIWFTVIFFKTV